MPAIKLEQFGGMLPAWDDRILPPGQCANAQNAYLFGGTLQGWRQPKLLRTLTNGAAKFVYRIPTITKTVAGAWLIFVAIPLEGDTVQIDEVVYKFTATVTNPYDVLIGASALDSATNLLYAVTADNGVHTNEGVKYGKDTDGNPSTDNTATGCSVGTSVLGAYFFAKAADAGVQYNTITVAASGGVQYWSSSSTVNTPTSTLTGGTNPVYDTTITGTSHWLEYVDPDTTVMRSPVVDDKYLRHYTASPTDRPKYNTYDRIMASSPFWYLGVPPPGCVPNVTVSGGGNSAKEGYPNPTLTGAGAISMTADYEYLVPFTPAGAMELLSVSFVAASDAATGKVKAVLYHDNSGTPSTLVNVGMEVQGVVSGATVTSAFLYPTGLIAGNTYWLGFISDSGFNVVASDDLGSHGYVVARAYASGPLNNASGGFSGAASAQVWGDMTTAAQLESRAYVYTYVTEYDEESPPSPPSLTTGYDNATWTVGLWEPPSEEMGTIRNITKIRVYRTIPSQSGVTEYFYVTEVAVGTSSVIDTATSDVIALNDTLQSTNWYPPPVDLQGITSMPNGICVGFRSNEVWFSEPYRPHAWPPGYVLTTEFPIVGVGVTGQSAVVCTTSMPYVATGVSPATMTLVKVPVPEPCLSRGSIVDRDDGVYYCSANGLIRIDAGGKAVNVTEAWITREKWRVLTPAKNHRAGQLLGLYLCFGSTTDGTTTYAQMGFNLQMNDDSASFGIWPQPGHHRMGFMKMTSPNGYNIDSFLIDPWSGTGLFVQNGGVYYYDFSDTAPTITPYIWRSKKYQQTDRKNMEALRIYFDVPTGTPAQGTRNVAAFNDASWNTLASNQYGIVRVYCDDVLQMAREIRTTGELLRIPSGYKVETWQFEFEARVAITNVQIATTVRELSEI